MRRIMATAFAAGLAAALAVGPSSAAEYEVSIAGAGPASLAYNLAAGLAENTNSKTELVRATAETSSGFVENVRLVGNGETEFGLVAGIHANQGLNATGSYEGEPAYSGIRGVLVAYTGNISWNAGEGIESFEDLAGETVSVGPPGSLISYIGELILEAYGIKDDVEILRLSYAESSRAFVDGTVAAFVGGPAPYPAVMEAGAQKKINILPVDSEHLEKIGKLAPVTSETVKAGAYDWLDEDVPTVGYVAYLITNSEVPEEAVYEVLRTNLSPEGQEYLKANHRVWSPWNTPDYIEKNKAFALEGMTLHPGAVKYWKEQGVELPEAILP